MYNRKLLSFILVLAMCFSLVQSSAFAITSDGWDNPDPEQQTGNIQLFASDLTSEPETTPAIVPEITPTPVPEASTFYVSDMLSVTRA